MTVLGLILMGAGVLFLLVAAILWPRRRPREDSLA